MRATHGCRTADGCPLDAYRICTETFRPSSDSQISAWVALINHAMQQWQTATGGLIRTERQTDASGGYAPCADYAGLIRVIADEIATFIPAATPGIDQQLYDLVLDFLNRFKEMGIVLDDSKMEEKYGDEDHTMRDLAANEIIMFNEGHPIDTIMRVGAFTEFAGNVGLVRSCWYKLDKNSGTLTFDDTTAMCTAPDQSRVDSTRDILIRRSKFETAGGQPADPLATPASNGRFNMCLNRGDTDSTAYESTLHEIGHVLGVGGDTGHPGEEGKADEFFDSVMDYNFSQPDCEPYPLDILAIYALYQVAVP